MEELRSTEVLDKEIRSDSVKKAEKIVCDSNDAKKIDALYDQYSKPLQSSDINKISIYISDWISHFDEKKQAEMDARIQSESVINLIMKTIHDEINKDKAARKIFKSTLLKTVGAYKAARSILLGSNSSEELKDAKLYTITNVILREFLGNVKNSSLSDEERKFFIKVISKVKQERQGIKHF